MQKCLRESDTLARMGGDEFVAILPTIANARDAAKVARKIRHSVCLPFELTDSVTVTIDCSIGVAIHPDHGEDEDSLLKSADDAMYVAKSLGRAKVYFAKSATEVGDGIRGTSQENRADEPLVWRSAYLCGEETIDRQHESIFAFCNSVILAIENGTLSLDRIPSIIDQLIADMTEHFAYEEAALSRLFYPGVDVLRPKHQVLLERARNLHRLAVAGELSMDALIGFIEWNGVAQHMLTDDHEYFPFLKRVLPRDSAKKTS
jgi:hemerythrin-like metal-binding protein